MEGRGGGSEVQAWLLAQELAGRNARVSYVAQSVYGKQGQTEIINGVEIRWIRYAHHFRWSNGLDYYRVLRDLAPDVVVQRMTSFITGVVGYYCKKHGKKFVWICTDNAAPARWLFWKKQVRANKTEKVNPLKAVVFLSNAFINDVSRHWGMKHVTYPFTQNDIQRQILEQAYNLDSYHMISGQQPPSKPGLPPKDKLSEAIVLWVANLAPLKRPEKFIELARLAEGTDLRFIMIGSRGDSDYLKALFKDQPGNLEWLGRLSFDETLNWFDRAAFFVNTSTNEGFPNTFIQAWLRAVPVFSLDVDPNGVIKNNKLGFLSDNVGGLLDNILSLLHNPDEYRSLADSVKTYSIIHHTISVIADNFLKVVICNQLSGDT
jgi:glycosyltransferase involved in cell wall biosynthesis